jgi:integrase
VEKGRDRYLKAAEIKGVWKATEAENPLTRALFRLVFLTAQRKGSVSAMRWDGIVGDVWTIPAEHFKGRRPHLVPLSAEALQIIGDLRADALSDEWIFPSRAGSKYPFLSNFGKALTRVRKQSGVPDWTLHDARTTFRTHAVRSPLDGGLGTPAHVADAVLGHKEASLGFSRYTGDQHLYMLAEKREALVAWGAFVCRAVEG